MPSGVLKKDTSVNDIKKFFSWFDEVFSALIKEACDSFFQYSPEIRLFSLEKNSKIFQSGNEYFVTQAAIGSVSLSVRLSETVCELFLKKVFGENDNKFFEFSSMTELEGSMLSKLNNCIFTAIKDILLSPKEVSKIVKKEVEEEPFKSIIRLGFVTKENGFETGKMFLSIPEEMIKYPEMTVKEGVLDTSSFTKAETLVDIFVGKTKLSLDEINNIESEDIVVLESSDIKKMKITAPTTLDFNVNPDPRLFMKDEQVDIEENETEDIMSGVKDIWDNVQVDVCAKFPKVKMSLGELREMTEGVVMELDSVYGNEVVLEVENKNVAKGELVIVGYKYGVKITEIYSQPESNEEKSTAQKPGNNADEDFDVNDFEIEE